MLPFPCSKKELFTAMVGPWLPIPDHRPLHLYDLRKVLSFTWWSITVRTKYVCIECKDQSYSDFEESLVASFKRSSTAFAEYLTLARSFYSTSCCSLFQQEYCYSAYEFSWKAICFGDLHHERFAMMRMKTSCGMFSSSWVSASRLATNLWISCHSCLMLFPA